MDLSTRYLGLELKNPVVPSASPLSRSLDTARALEDAGASALVMYSLFEEELNEQMMQSAFLQHQDVGYSEAESFLPVHTDPGNGLDRYLEQLHRLKEALSIPVIASLNGISLDGWVENGRLQGEKLWGGPSDVLPTASFDGNGNRTGEETPGGTFLSGAV